MPYRKRFYHYVDKSAGPEGCWMWTGCCDAEGYGVAWGGKTMRKVAAHRLSWKLAMGPIPPGMCVCHHCDTSGCVNPAHLFLGTHADNMRDMYSKKRHPRSGACGEASGKAKLTENEVREIRALHGTMTYKEIAKQFGIGKTTVWTILSGRTWRHLLAPSNTI